jgi:hypothetical protein
MRKFYAVFLIFSLVFYCSCDYTPYPYSQKNKDTSWVSEDYKMFFLVVWETEGGYTTDIMLGFWVKDDEVIEFDFSHLGNDIYAFKTDIEPSAPITKERKLFEGTFKYRNGGKKFTITVTDTNVENIKIDDKITFNRVDELPDWAAEVLENWENGQLSSTDNTRDDAA